MDILIAGLRIALLAYLSLTLVFYLFQKRFIYYPTREVQLRPGDIGLDFEDLKLPTADGERLGAWLVPAAAARTAPYVLFCHGNAGNLEHRLQHLRGFREIGVNVLMFDYRGYGTSTGRPDEEGTYADALAAWNYLTEERKVPPSAIALHGESLGGGVAVWLAARVTPGALVVESSFTSLVDLGRRVLPFLPVGWLCRHRYESLGRIASLRCPVLIAHGRNDTMIPYEMAQRLFQAAPAPKLFLNLEGNHNDGGLMANEANRPLRVVYRGFLEQAGLWQAAADSP